MYLTEMVFGIIVIIAGLMGDTKLKAYSNYGKKNKKPLTSEQKRKRAIRSSTYNGTYSKKHRKRYFASRGY